MPFGNSAPDRRKQHQESERCGASIPTGLCPSAQGCEARATLGERMVIPSSPTGLRRNVRSRPQPFQGWGCFCEATQGSPLRGQPWAEGWNPVGIQHGNSRKALPCCAVPARVQRAERMLLASSLGSAPARRGDAAARRPYPAKQKRTSHSPARSDGPGSLLRPQEFPDGLQQHSFRFRRHVG